MSVPKPTFPYLATIIAFTAIVIMLLLGFWQLDRKSEKELRLAQIENAKGEQSISLKQAVLNPLQYQDYQATAVGQFSEELIFIDNKIRDGKPGFYVLTPLTTNYGVLMVNLGWVPAMSVRGTLPTIAFPYSADELSTLEGLIYIPTHNTLIKETNTEYGRFPALLQQVDLNEISQHLRAQVLPFVLRLLPNSNSYFVREWNIITMAPEKHLAYAIQWFGLAIAALTVYLLSLRKRS